MFDFFKKEQDPIRGHLGDFQDIFTKEQKAAIVSSLVIVAKSDGNIHPKEWQYIEQAGKILGIKMEDPIFPKIASSGRNEIIKILDKLAKSQKDGFKEWFIVSLHSMTLADGRPNATEVNCALMFAEGIGVSEDEYVQIIDKAELLMKSFMG